ncbi:roundabout homolog 1-like [Panulirus ornatus]|uniref:roundabout homolog 1-like n=1 Tax=Panulirus ornatus TaxID=150431 RepID=UPI003A85C227
MAKAFESVNHTTIERVMLRKGIPAPVREYIMSTFDQSFTHIEDNGELLEEVKISRGVKRGDPLSPIFFKLVIDEGITRVKESGVGIRFGDQKVPDLPSSTTRFWWRRRLEIDGKRKTWYINKNRTFKVLGSSIGSMDAADDYKVLAEAGHCGFQRVGDLHHRYAILWSLLCALSAAIADMVQEHKLAIGCLLRNIGVGIRVGLGGFPFERSWVTTGCSSPRGFHGGPPVIKEHPTSIVARRNDPATLNCAASEAANIKWFRDGEEVATSQQDSRSHRFLLPSGSLFFLRVTTTKRDSDAGTYWCVASNRYGATRSHNATLTVAMIAYDFQRQAEPVVKTRVGSSLVLPCRPPKGSPPPELSWLRDGHQVTNSSRVAVIEAGDLVITEATQEDSATYVCLARNAAGVRESSPSQLIVMTPPWFEARPDNLTVATGAMVELMCRAQGSPTPTVTWRRLDGKMPLGRATVEEDQRLALKQVATEDSGVYMCEVENEAGMAAAQATLTVIDTPKFTQKPQDLQVMAGDTAQISCHVKGDPEPLVLWRLPTLDRTALLIPGQSSGHTSVSDDGLTLLIKQAAAEDSGTYCCWGVSSGGGVSAWMEVVVLAAHPPPVMGVGPQDLTVAPGSVATFLCEVVSEAAEATISWWYRSAKDLLFRQISHESANPRFAFPANGALILKNVRQDDAGVYTCHASAATGSVEEAAVLRIMDDSVDVEPQRLPPPPTKPRLVAVNRTAVQLSWLPNSQVSGGDTKQSYTVEYWRQGWDEWRVADAIFSRESCVVSHLTPGHTYTFLVRAVSRKGASYPSPWSDPVTTRSARDPTLTVDQVRQARRRLSRPIVTLTNAALTASDSVLLSWNYLTPTDESLEGVLVYSVAEGGTVQVATVLGASSSSHLLPDLRPNTPYTFFVVPFWHSVEGTPSNSYLLTTPEEVPMTAPGELHVIGRKEGSVLIRWSSVGAEEARGELVGYQVMISHNGSQTTETVVNPWLETHDLLPSRLYTVRVAAVTGAGPGPFSDPVLVDVGPSGTLSHQEVNATTDSGGSVLYAPPQPAWLVYLLLPLVLLLFLATLLYVRRLHQKAPSSNPPHTPALYQNPYNYPEHHSVNMYGEQNLWGPSESDKGSSVSSTRLLHLDHLVSEYTEPQMQRPSDSTTEPYATTALLAPDSPHLKHGAPWAHHSDDSGVQVNWSDILPPPPACPPPLDLGDPAGGSDPQRTRPMFASSQYDNVCGSERYGAPCDATSEHTYEMYAHITPADCRERPYYSSLQGRESHMVRAECHPLRPADQSRSNTH